MGYRFGGAPSSASVERSMRRGVHIVSTAPLSRSGIKTDAGISMAEIIVAMFLIGILALSVLPIFAQTMKLSATNVTLARANQLVNARIDLIRSQGEKNPYCNPLPVQTIPKAPEPADSATPALTYTQAVACPPTYPGVATVTVTVKRTDTGAVVSSAVTLIAVQAAAVPTP